MSVLCTLDPAVQSVVSLTAILGVASLIPAQSHTLVEIDNEIIPAVFLVRQLQVKVLCAGSIG